MSRLERRFAEARHRTSLRTYRRESEGMLLTYLTSPDDAALNSMPILRRAAQRWLNDLATKVRSCIVCSNWIPDKSEAGALLLSTPVNPTLVSVCGICRTCSDLPLEALRKPASANCKQRFLEGVSWTMAT